MIAFFSKPKMLFLHIKDNFIGLMTLIYNSKISSCLLDKAR